MNASTFDEASDIDYFITNVDGSTATSEWIVTRVNASKII
jgi:hypothetical protein